MGRAELYEITRKEWRLNPRRDPDYAFAIHGGVVRGVFRIDRWEPGVQPGRWMFEGTADDEMERRYVGQDVSEYFPPGAANPVQYANC